MKPRTKKELANLYGVNIKTLSNWFKKKNIEVPRGAIMPADLEKIFEKIGHPENTRKRTKLH